MYMLYVNSTNNSAICFKYIRNNHEFVYIFRMHITLQMTFVHMFIKKSIVGTNF